jgi:hypothetical protein
MPRKSLNLTSTLTEEVASLAIERRFYADLTMGLGLQGTKANVTPEANPNPFTASAPSQHYSLISLPAYLKLDETDDLLNPTRGYRAQLAVAPAHTVSCPPLRTQCRALPCAHSVGPSPDFRIEPGCGQHILAPRRGAAGDPCRQTCRCLYRWCRAGPASIRPADLRGRRWIDPPLRLSTGGAARYRQQTVRR